MSEITRKTAAGAMGSSLTRAGLDDVRAAWLSQRGRDSRRRLWNSGLFVVAVVVLDVTGYFIGSSAGRYILVAVAIFLVSVARTPLNRLTIRGPEVPDFFLLVLFVYGIVGSVYGIAFMGTRSPALVLFLPMILGLLHLTTIGPVEADEARVYLRRWSLVTALYVVVLTASALGWLERFGGGGANPAANVAGAVFGHEKAFFVCLALAAAWLRGRRRLFVVLLGLSLLAFSAYPAATYLVAGAVAMITLVATGRRSGRPRRYAMFFLGLLLIGLIVSEVSGAGPSARADLSSRSSISSSYFGAVGKANNNETRAELWSTAWNNLLHAPVFGSGFTGDTALDVRLAGKNSEVPPHNDFLQMGMGGGFVGMGLLIGWVVVTNAFVIGRFKRLRATRQASAAALLRVLLVGYNSFFAVAFLNPIMSRFGLNVSLMLLYSMMMTIGTPPVSPQPTVSYTRE